jgi:hypothetical protein
MADTSDFKKVLAKNVTLQFLKLNGTYRFNTATQRSEPCAPTASNAAWSVAFDMPDADAKALVAELKEHYAASRSRNTKLPEFKTVFGAKRLKDKDGNPTGMTQFTAKKNGTKKNGDRNEPPTVIDGAKQPMTKLDFWGGSVGTVRAWAVAVIDPDGAGGISLLLDAVQVTDAKFGDGGMDDFDTVEVKKPADDPFGDIGPAPVAQVKAKAALDDLDADSIPF